MANDPPDRLKLDTDFLTRWTDGEPVNVLKEAVRRERLRCVGVVLHEYGLMIAAGEGKIAAVLDTLATRLEYPDLEG